MVYRESDDERLIHHTIWNWAFVGIVGLVVAASWLSGDLNPFISHCHMTPESTCICNLKQIDSAKEQWAMDQHKATGSIPEAGFLSPTYIKSFPKCPSGGTYAINAVGTDPTCGMANHALPKEYERY